MEHRRRLHPHIGVNIGIRSRRQPSERPVNVTFPRISAGEALNSSHSLAKGENIEFRRQELRVDDGRFERVGRGELDEATRRGRDQSGDECDEVPGWGEGDAWVQPEVLQRSLSDCEVKKESHDLPAR
jgi:hypothetical protein